MIKPDISPVKVTPISHYKGHLKKAQGLWNDILRKGTKNNIQVDQGLTSKMQAKH